MISRFWTLYHQVVKHVQSYNQRIRRLNFVWPISTVFLPFAANPLNSGRENNRLTYALNLGTMLVTSISLGDRFRAPPQPRTVRTPLGDVRKGLIAAGLLAVALVLAVIFPGIGMYWVLLHVLQGSIARLLSDTHK